MIEYTEIERFLRVGDWLAKRGWAEANAGNMSIRLEPDQIPSLESTPEEFEMEHPFPALDGVFFLVTATHSRARDISMSPGETLGLLEIAEGGTRYRCHWGVAPPTSEFPAHLAIHGMCLEGRPDMKAILHTHPPYLVAMSQMEDFQKPGDLSRALMRMHPEVGILVPDGIAHMDYEIPGTLELGVATRDALFDCNVAVWPMHGVVSLAPDLEKALDQVEIVEKAARIYMTILATGRKPVGLTDEQIRKSRERWGIKGGPG